MPHSCATTGRPRMETRDNMGNTMELNQLRQIIAIADESVLSRAAERLHLSQSALTRSIQRLEDELGMPLFDRTKNSMRLNEAGQIVVKHARHVIRDAEALVAGLEAYRKQHMNLHIVTCAPAPLWKLNAELSGQFPDMHITSDMPDELEIVSLLLTEKATIAIVRQEIHTDAIESIPFVEEQLYMQIPLSDPLSAKKSIHFSDLRGREIREYIHTGFWHRMHRDCIREAKYIEYDDIMVYTNVVMSQKPLTFITELANTLHRDMEGCVCVPIVDAEATAHYRIAYLRKNKSMLSDVIGWIAKACRKW